MANNLTRQELQDALPRELRTAVTDNFVASFNKSISDPLHRETIGKNAIGMVHILNEGRFKVVDYLNAVKYCSFKTMGYSNIDAYRATFPARYKRLLDDGADSKYIHAVVAGYKNGKLVERIMEYILTPVWLLNADVYQEAINTQADLMRTAKSEMVRTQAANSILTHVKRPEVKESSISVKVDGQESVIDQIRSATQELRDAQKASMSQGVTIDQIAEAKVVNPEED